MPPTLACLLLLYPQARAWSIKAQLQARYDALTRAAVRGDESVFGGLFTADFAGESPDGHRIGRRAALATFGGLMASGGTRSWPMKVLQVRMDRGDALAIVLGDYKSVFATLAGKKHVHEVLTVTMDRWHRTPGGWRLAGSGYLRFAEFSGGRDVTPARWRNRG